MQNEYFAFISAAYGVSALSLLGLALWLFLDARGRQRELKALEARGIRRRSDASARGTAA
ncbi:heme exporter protein CcmD [Consotaella salsifontis]|uniref:Heme exporter protein D n=1 Tax=Consotaella salsifontis TaxID=1365950 RepID=A0A1T4RZ56_9HYPH|nr:heme exporter protein CcmD [Consotaella salsifontis]SKA21225.1 heme exporter protein D [Consotaella salsifontis]